ncbi:GHMP kinase [Acetobacterium tundrae]|uniref:GHMP kinase n=1 Tax=Acetobacterium tundrae TaxID=132932 RepID=A0ABR6WI63_9FIRM|nr:GHMP kinase [Acetobacterium tundrae]MBC3795973.1 GHMP kinase [Acetobacterium tundrae]
MRRVKVKTPGTCGEFIQGWFDDNPCLVSCPIDRYSNITIEEGPGNLNLLKPKTVKLIEEVFRLYAIPNEEKEKLHITMDTEIPLEKGMASSTADIAGMAAGLSEYFGLGLTPKEIGALCAVIEPSDNLMFSELNLFNHINGVVLKNFDGCVEADLIIVDFHGGIDTMSFNETQDDYSDKDLETFSEIVNLFEKGVRTKSLKDIGAACTKSAFLNQKRLKKQYLEEITTLSKKFGGLGTVIGHSGTVIGVMYKKENFQEVEFIKALKTHIPETAYAELYFNHLIPGGITVSQEEI